MYRTHHNKILIFAIVASLLIHAAALVWIKDMKIDFYSSGRAFMEHHMYFSNEPQSDEQKKEDKQKRSDELAAIFNNIVQIEVPEESLTYDEKNVTSDMFPSTFSQGLDQEFSFDEPTLVNIDFGSDMSEYIPKVNSEKETALQNAVLEKEILNKKEDTLVDDLIQAAEIMQGKITSELPDLVSSLDSLPIGNVKVASIEGNSLQERNGLLDHGFTDTTVEEDSTLLSSGEVNTLKNDILKQFSTKGKAFAHLEHTNNLPKGNRSAARSANQSNSANIASRDDFDFKVTYSRKKDQSGYLFKLELVPKPGAVFKRIKQNYFFLVDRSHSIRPLRYETTKQAVIDAMDVLQEGDTFNILVFDEKVVRFAPANVPWTKDNAQRAKQFIYNQKYAGAFTSTDLYTSLENIIPHQVAEQEVNTAILLSDGDTFLSKQKQRESINNWTTRNHGKVSLFSVPAGGGNNLALLELLSVFNRGLLFHAPKDRMVGETLLALLYALQNPIGKDIVASVVTKGNAPRSLYVFPTLSRLPNLYEHIPYVLYGYTDRLDDFYLFIQGKYYDKSLDIKELVSFDKAAFYPHSPELEMNWDCQQAYIQYEMFLNDGQKDRLKVVKRILAPYKIPTAFQ